MKPGIVQFILLTYNPNISRVKKLLQIFSEYHVVIVDNSVIAKRKLPDKISKNCVVLHQKSNTGYAEGVNTGLYYTFHKDAIWSVILNDDIEVKKVDVDKFCYSVQRIVPGVAGPQFGYLDAKRWTTILEKDKDPSEKPTSYVTGSFFAVHKEVYRKIGGHWDPYFMYYEDVDYCIRARRAGFILTRIPISSYHHYESQSMNIGSFSYEYYHARNHLYFVERNAPKIVKSHEFLRMPKTLHEHVKNKNWGALSGVRDYFFRKTGSLGLV